MIAIVVVFTALLVMLYQGQDPATDFRGAGVFGLDNLLYLAREHPQLWHKLRYKTQGVRAEWEYPFAVAGLNLTFMLAEVLDLQGDREPQKQAGKGVVEVHNYTQHPLDMIPQDTDATMQLTQMSKMLGDCAWVVLLDCALATGLSGTLSVELWSCFSVCLMLTLAYVFVCRSCICTTDVTI